MLSLFSLLLSLIYSSCVRVRLFEMDAFFHARLYSPSKFTHLSIVFGIWKQGIDEAPKAPSPKGFHSIVTQSSGGKVMKADYSFEAPCIVRVRSRGKKGEFIFGAALHCIPVGKGRSRLLFKVMSCRVLQCVSWARLCCHSQGMFACMYVFVP